MTFADVLTPVAIGAGTVAAAQVLSWAARRGSLDPLVFDLNRPDDHHVVDLVPVARDARVAGGMFKTSEGLYGQYTEWWVAQWKAAAAASAAARPWPWQVLRRGPHHYLTNQDGRAQADRCADVVDAAGGLAHTDFGPWVDIEHAAYVAQYQLADASKQQLLDVALSCTERLRERLGRPVTWYVSTSLLEEKGITKADLRGLVWKIVVADYNPTLDRAKYERVGFSVGDLWGWQYNGVTGAGVSEGQLAGYPTSLPGLGEVDLTAMQIDPLEACAPLRFFA